MKKATKIICIVIITLTLLYTLLWIFGSEAGLNRFAPYHNKGNINIIVNGEEINVDETEIDWEYFGTAKIRNGKFKFAEGAYGDNLFAYKIPGYEYITVKFGHFNTNWWHVNKYDVNISVIDNNETVYVEAEQKINSDGMTVTDKNSINIARGKKTDLWIYLGP